VNFVRGAEELVDLIHPQVGRYLANLARSSDPVLEEMERLASIRSFPIVGPQVGALLHVLASSIGARSVLELGSGFGYSAQWFARAVGPTGRVVLIEHSPERAAEAEEFLGRSGLLDRTRIEVGDALEIGETLEGPFDIVFNDIDKQDYPAALDVAGDRLREGGLFISDNMLWQGNVLEPETNDAATRGVLELTRRLYASDAWITTLLPLRDGVTISLKQG
jgi:predicted O-methyltransferase YrrM